MENCRDFDSLKNLFKEGENFDIDLSVPLKKLTEYIKSKYDNTIKIVLLGSFSDGKTTVMAGLLGKLEENMKIDEDESSDELSIYHVESLGNNYEVVDTPGLFGTKEKEIDGVNVRFSEITERYISEAHIVIYVTNSRNTFKDSHKETIKKILRDYNKLDSAIFVINKMDNIADTNDEEDYTEHSLTKRKTFINRLKQCINLTPEEEKNVRIACIAANPKKKGLIYWFNKKDEYKKRSHIHQLESCIAQVINNSNEAKLKESTDQAVAYDLARGVLCSISLKISELNDAITKANSSLDCLEENLSVLKSSIIHNKELMSDSIENHRKALLATINDISSKEEFQVFLENEIGIKDSKVDYSVIMRKLKQIISEYTEANNTLINTEITNFERIIDAQNRVINNVVEAGLAGMKKVNGATILKARDLLFKGYKFKPWGAIKLAKYIGAAAAVLGLLYDGWKLYKKHTDAKELGKTKLEIKDILNTIYNDVFKLFEDNNEYYKNFAPSYIELKEHVEQRRKDIKILYDNTISLDKYRRRFQEWYGNDIQDVEFEEIV